VCEKSQFNG